jgi:choline monooxygenase
MTESSFAVQSLAIFTLASATLFYGISLIAPLRLDKKRAEHNGQSQKSSLDAVIAAFDPSIPIERARTPPASWYLSPDMFVHDTRTVFQRSWHPAARVEQLQNPGDYVAGEFLGVAYALVRDKEGVLRAFYNTCRHHAAVILGTPASQKASAPAGNIKSIICPYHGWDYKLSGELSCAPKTAGCEFKLEDNGLVQLKVDTWGPFVFISFDRDAPPLAGKWSEALKRLNSMGLKNLKYHSSRTYEVPCNWKVYVDNYLDGVSIVRASCCFL